MQSQTRGTPARYRLLLASAHSPIRTARISLANEAAAEGSRRATLLLGERAAIFGRGRSGLAE
jgi:hypothetical protein